MALLIRLKLTSLKQEIGREAVYKVAYVFAPTCLHVHFIHYWLVAIQIVQSTWRAPRGKSPVRKLKVCVIGSHFQVLLRCRADERPYWWLGRTTWSLCCNQPWLWWWPTPRRAKPIRLLPWRCLQFQCLCRQLVDPYEDNYTGSCPRSLKQSSTLYTWLPLRQTAWNRNWLVRSKRESSALSEASSWSATMHPECRPVQPRSVSLHRPIVKQLQNWLTCEVHEHVDDVVLGDRDRIGHEGYQDGLIDLACK